MRMVLQRVGEASVTIEGKRVSAIGKGILVLLCVETGDTQSDADWMLRKCVNLRIFDDDAGVMNRSLLDVGGQLLVVSQFTLAASVRKGNRPSYVGAAGHDIAVPLYEYFCAEAEKALGSPEKVGRGRFGADMKVTLVNDGPVTIIVNSPSHE